MEYRGRIAYGSLILTKRQSTLAFILPDVTEHQEYLPITCGQLVLWEITLPLVDVNQMLDMAPIAAVSAVTYATHKPSTKTLTSNSEVSSGCRRLSMRRLAWGCSQLWMDTRKGLLAGRLGTKVVRTGNWPKLP